jgi:hypothetical protein
MSGVFRNIDPPPPPHRPERGEDTLARGRGGGVNSSEDARHCSVLYICKYFVEISVVYAYYNNISTPTHMLYAGNTHPCTPHSIFSLLMQTQGQILIIWVSSIDNYSLPVREGGWGGGGAWVRYISLQDKAKLRRGEDCTLHVLRPNSFT